MKIKHRLLGYSLLSIAFSLMIGGVGLWVAGFLGKEMDANLVAMNAMHASMDADMMHDALRADVLAAIVAAGKGDKAGLDAAKSDTREHGERFRKAIDEVRTLKVSPAVEEILRSLAPRLESYIQSAESMVGTAGGGVAGTEQRLPQFLEAFGALEDEMEKLSGGIETYATAVQGSANKAVRWSEMGIGTIAGVSGLILIVLSLWLTRSIAMPLQRAVGIAQSIAGGNLDSAIEVRGNDETAQLLAAMKDMQQNLSRMISQTQSVVEAAGRGDLTRRVDGAGMKGFQREMADGINSLISTCESGIAEVVRVLAALAVGDLTQTIEARFQGTFEQLKGDANKTVSELRGIVGQLKSAIDAINGASGEIASGNADLSGRTEQQASSLEETASSLEELTSTVRHNADNARQANQLAIDASRSADRGGEIVRKVVGTMQGISESSKRVSDILGVIDGIAFQTNILALNAAVEAARAGEQGKGFAVVASEVRNLAQRSAAAAKEIKTLIETSATHIEEGGRLVAESGASMEEIVGSIRRVTGIMSEISAASAEQSSGIEQINMAVSQMDQVTQQNSALVEEMAAAAESLEEQARGLTQAAGRFRLEAVKAPPAVRVRAA